MTSNYFLQRWSHLTFDHCRWVVGAFLFLTLASLFFSYHHLKIRTDKDGMISAELPWRQLDIQYTEAFPHVVDNLAIVVSASTPDEAVDTAILLEQALQKEADTFSSIFYFRNLEFIRKSSLLFMEVDELEDLTDKLATYQPFLASLIEDQTVSGFTDLLITAFNEAETDTLTDIKPLIEAYVTAYQANLDGEHYTLSWQSLFQDEKLKAQPYREIIIAQPKLDYNEALPAEAAISRIYSIAETLSLENKPSVSMDITGTVAIDHEELQSVSQTNFIAVVSALILVTLFLITTLGAYLMVIVALITLLVGLAITAGLATLIVGQINLISIAFAVLYIGLGIDFAIHYCLKYRELAGGALPDIAIFAEVLNFQWRPLSLCAVTTAIGFYSFLNTDYVGIAELGVISGTGMFVSLFTTLTLTPALIRYFNIRASSLSGKSITSFIDRINIEQYRSVILVVTTVLIGASLYLVQYLYFDNNLINLQPQKNPSVIAFRNLITDDSYTPLNASLLMKNETAAQDIVSEFNQLPTVKDVFWLNSFIPEDQDIKLGYIDDIDLLAGDTLSTSQPYSASNRDDYGDLEGLIDTIDTRINNGEEIELLQRWKQALTQIKETFEKLPKDKRQSYLKNIEQSIFINLHGRLNALHHALRADYITKDNLPIDFKNRWFNQEYYRLEINPVHDVSDNQQLEEFTREIQAVHPSVTGPTIVNKEAGREVTRAFKEAFITAIAGIFMFLLITLRHRMDIPFILAPLFIAVLFTGATAVVLGFSLNFANMIALPLIFAIGVDSAIHIVNQHRQHEDSQQLMQSSTTKAIFVSGMTTILSIGNLALSPHIGTASMGGLLVVGISNALICTLLITPALLALRR